MATTKRKKGGKRKEKKNIPFGIAHIHATFNNTIITITDPQGNVLAWSSAGCTNFKGSRKGVKASDIAGWDTPIWSKDAPFGRKK